MQWNVTENLFDDMTLDHVKSLSMGGVLYYVIEFTGEKQ